MARKAPTTSARQPRRRPQPRGSLLQWAKHPGLVSLLLISSVLLLVMLALAIGGEDGFLTMWRMEREVERLAEEVRIIEQENRDLQREVWRLQHDMAYVERIARQELGFVRRGEIVFEFIE